jgi:hypothetical protein
MLHTLVRCSAVLGLVVPVLAGAAAAPVQQPVVSRVSALTVNAAVPRNQFTQVASLGTSTAPGARPLAMSQARESAPAGKPGAHGGALLEVLEDLIPPDMETLALALAFMGLMGLIARRGSTR